MAFWVIYMQIYEVILILFLNGMVGNFYIDLGGYFISFLIMAWWVILYKFKGYFISSLIMGNFLENIVDLTATIIRVT